MTIKNQTGVMFEGKLFDVERVEHNGHDYDVVKHPSSVAVVPYDEQYVYMVRQWRPAVNCHKTELVAGTYEPLSPRQRWASADTHPPSLGGYESDRQEVAQRELAEELGMGAHDWQYIMSFDVSPGYCDEKIALFLAADLFELGEDAPEHDPEEDIQIVKWPLKGRHLDHMIRLCHDAKTAIGLYALKARLAK